jgi:uncharacterized OB-fold protein/acyl dehydratase
MTRDASAMTAGAAATTPGTSAMTAGAAAKITPEGIRAAADRIAAAGDSEPRLARDPVNLPMIRNWLEALAAPGDSAQRGAGPGAGPGAGQGAGPECPDTAPPAMIQVWTMPGLHGARAGDDPLAAMVALLDEAGYPSIVATNCDQVYRRPVKLGERLAVSARLVDVAGPKRTALGEGWFVTTRSTWTSAGEPVATMDFRVLKYCAAPGGAIPPMPPLRMGGLPAPPSPPGGVIRPVTSPDTEFFWAGAADGELRVQRCGGCGVLRHPPGPMCPSCGAMSSRPPGYVVAAGTGEVYSYVVHHHPPVPGKKLPVVIALVQLTEGVRMTGELLGASAGQVRIGLPVRAEFVRVDDELTLPAWRPLSAVTLPPLTIDVTPTFVIASALATRDFQDVHHDRDRAVAGGAKDIFLNILTTTGLVQRYVAAWAGPDAVFRSVSVRLGVPCHAGDTLTLTGEVSLDDSASDGSHGDGSPGDGRVISVVGRCCGPGGQLRGDHVTATVRLASAGDR